MTQRLDTTIQRPVTDFRHYSSVLRADPDVLQAWNLVEKGAYPDPESSVGGMKLSSRLVGGLPLQSHSPTPDHSWEQRGGFNVSRYLASAANGVGAWKVEIPNPGDIFSVILVCKPDLGFTEPLGFDWADLNLNITANVNGKIRISTLSGGVNQTNDLAPDNACDLGTWSSHYFVFDAANSEVHGSVNAGQYSSATIPHLVSQPDDNLWLAVGRITTNSNNQNFDDGSIAEVVVLKGDIRNKPSLVQATELYNATGYEA